jgi:hypothetical protein
MDPAGWLQAPFVSIKTPEAGFCDIGMRLGASGFSFLPASIVRGAGYSQELI